MIILSTIVVELQLVPTEELARKSAAREDEEKVL